MKRISAAEMLLQELGVTEPREIDLEAIAYYRGATVKHCPLDGCEAQIVGYGNRCVITVSTRTSRRRQRFTLGHELGHWHFHRGRSFICRPDDINNPARDPTDPERVADGYAADLLLPRYLFLPRAQDARKTTIEVAETLKEEFDTSLTATLIRLVDMRIEPSFLVCHTRSGRKWFVRGNDIDSNWIPQRELDSESPAFDVLFGSTQKTRRTRIGADAWFDRRDAQKYELFEQSIRLGADEILSLLTIVDEEMLQ